LHLKAKKNNTNKKNDKKNQNFENSLSDFFIIFTHFYSLFVRIKDLPTIASI